ncbi:MAG: hypothetical protein NVS2B15_12820 [Pseudarthrobacter sp.]
MRQITDGDRGRFEITTATGSVYLISLLDERKITRLPVAAVPAEGFQSVAPSQLRRDGEELDLLMLEICQIGLSPRFWIRVRADVPTLRTTSPVTCIRLVS